MNQKEKQRSCSTQEQTKKNGLWTAAQPFSWPLESGWLVRNQCSLVNS